MESDEALRRLQNNESNPNYPDSGWKFMAGNEDAPIGTQFIRVPGGKFEEDDGSKPISIEKQ